MLTPSYDDEIATILAKVRADPTRQRLADAIDDAINLICDHPESAEAKRRAVDLPDGRGRLVPVRCRDEDDDWVVVWFPEGDLAVIVYVGAWRSV